MFTGWVCPTQLISKPAMVGLTLLLAIGAASAQTNSANYAFLVAAGFLCDSGDSSACPAVAKSVDGSSYELSGAGTFMVHSKSVTAAGTFTHKSSQGNLLDTGVWVATELVSFESYGVAPAALPREGLGPGRPPIGPMRARMLAGPMPSGGLAVFRIRLLPMRGAVRTARLQVNCALGKAPDERPTDGIRLAVDGGGADFDQEVSGRTIFLLTRSGASRAPKSPAAGDETNPPSAQIQQ